MAYGDVVGNGYIEITDGNYNLNSTDRWRITTASPTWPDNFIHSKDQGRGSDTIGTYFGVVP